MHDANTYDDLPYDALAFAASHPDRLATVALLAGLEPPSLERCRVLELGCGTGGNLLPIAVSLPDAEFVGIDLSERQVATGHVRIEAAGLQNVRIERADIARLDAAIGTFDFIICHGVYSWVPEVVQDRILALCNELLTPNGLAYISYNVRPGWHLRSGLRELLLHMGAAGTAESRVRAAREQVERLVESLPKLDGTYAQMLAALARTLVPAPDSYLFHEYLEADNRPVYFRDFVARAAAHGLGWAGDSTLANQLGGDAKRAERLANSIAPADADLIWREQCTDLLYGCAFRRSVLYRRGSTPPRADVEAAVMRLRVTAHLRRASDTAPLATDATETFNTPAGVEASTNHPLLKTAFLVASEAWPESLTFDDLWRSIRTRLADTPLDEWIDEGRDRPYVAAALAHAESSGLIDLHSYEPRICAAPGERPLASPYARRQAERGETRVVNLRHRTVELSVFDQTLLALLDGRNDRAALVDALTVLVRSGAIELERDGRSLADDPAALGTELPAGVDGGLARLVAAGMIMA